MLVDTTAWIDLLRGRDTRQTTALGRLVDLGEAAVSLVIVQEILQGARDEMAFRRLRKQFVAMPMLGSADPLRLAESAAQLYARARWNGITPRSPHHCLIAVTAVTEGVPLLSADAKAYCVTRPAKALGVRDAQTLVPGTDWVAPTTYPVTLTMKQGARSISLANSRPGP